MPSSGDYVQQQFNGQRCYVITIPKKNTSPVLGSISSAFWFGNPQGLQVTVGNRGVAIACRSFKLAPRAKESARDGKKEEAE